MNLVLPQARSTKLLVQSVGQEIVVFDRETQRIHKLNRTAALIWRHCDGRRSVPQLAALLREGLNVPDLTEEVIWLALERFAKTRLLRTVRGRAAGLNLRPRRTSVLWARSSPLMPSITSLRAPTPLMAKSSECLSDVDCFDKDLPVCLDFVCSRRPV
jgi:hypothetical protein